MRAKLGQYGAAALALALGSACVVACSSGEDGQTGPQGPAGPQGQSGTPGTPGSRGDRGENGAAGANGAPGAQGAAGAPGASALVSDDLATYVRDMVAKVKADASFAASSGFPVPNSATDTVRALPGTQVNLVGAWLDPLTWNDGINAPRMGANVDFMAFFGEPADGRLGTLYTGSSNAGWIWVNHEYVSGSPPAVGAVGTRSHEGLAAFLRDRGVLNFDVTSPAEWTQARVDAYVPHYKRQIGGSWFRVVRDPASGAWSIDRSAANLRYDATSATLVKVTGVGISAGNKDDTGNDLPAGVVSGINGDCSGTHTPWGTIITAEENVQDYYGDLEPCYDGNNAWVASNTVCQPGQNLTFDVSPTSNGAFSRASSGRHNRDYYGYLVEIDVGQAPGEYYGKTTAGVGHQKLGSLGRARWENSAIAMGSDWKLVDNKPIVMYSGDDRRGGRIYKWVSKNVWRSTMTKAQTRALLEQGDLYVAHFADLFNNNGLTITNNTTRPTKAAPGNGVWIKLSVDNTTQDAPNATALGAAGTKVGAALKNISWNGLAGFADDDTVRKALFTASNKIGVRELNRPEDIEWNPFDKLVYIAFTNHGRSNMLDAEGKLDTRTDAVKRGNDNPNWRPDRAGAVFALEEADKDNPGTSTTFKFWGAWFGNGPSPASPSQKRGLYDAANPDNLVIDPKGGVWFTTDGNPGTNGTADGIYYIDLPTGFAFRVATTPSDAEATGPAFTPDGKTMFFNVQHPGEDIYTTWPTNSKYGGLSGMVSISVGR
jgi:secreted PhoX family phosphatase